MDKQMELLTKLQKQLKSAQKTKSMLYKRYQDAEDRERELVKTIKKASVPTYSQYEHKWVKITEKLRKGMICYNKNHTFDVTYLYIEKIKTTYTGDTQCWSITDGYLSNNIIGGISRSTGFDFGWFLQNPDNKIEIVDKEEVLKVIKKEQDRLQDVLMKSFNGENITEPEKKNTYNLQDETHYDVDEELEENE